MVISMTREQHCEKIEEALMVFDIEGQIQSYERYGNGHINDTFVVVCHVENENRRYILQRMNHEIFTHPEQLISNIYLVTDFLRKKISKSGGQADRETLNLVKTKQGENFYQDSIGSYWRMYLFIEGATSYDQVEKKEDFYESAVAFGRFQRLLATFDASALYETIPDFHNTPVRYSTFLKAVEEDVCDRVKYVKDEIDFVLSHKKDAEICQRKLEEGKLPLRVTHNDTKLNNIMIDDHTGKGICVIDLDTVMPGLSIFDFGDSIRFGANTAAEDETNLSKVSLNLELFELYVKGFLLGCGGSLTAKEVDMLPNGAKTITLECGMRFLTDYLQGDQYFRIHRENHNLDRCRTQFALVKDMETKWDSMKSLVSKYC